MEKRVETKYGAVEGFEENGLMKYLGIPYAAQPKGVLRWKRARECGTWKGVLQAKKYGPAAFQEENGTYLGADECLTANVVRPMKGKGLPVLVWIHGGGYANGSAANPLYHGDSFAQDGIVYVSFQYRLNVFGFYDFSTYEDCGEMESNRGLSDMIMALKWVHENIEAFGGNPEKVTLGGVSAGGAAVTALMAAPSAKGYFRQAIAQSPLCNCVTTKEVQRKNIEMFLEGLGWGEEGLYQKLVAARPLELVKAARYQEKICQYRYPGIFGPGPVIDDLLPRRPLDAIKNGCAEGVKLIIGTNLHEGTMFVHPENPIFPNCWDMIHEMFEKNGHIDAYDAVKAYYDDPEKEEKYGDCFVHFTTDYVWEVPSIKAAMYQSKHADTWMYRFEYLTKSAKDTGMLAAHAFDIPCVFGVREDAFSRLLFDGEPEETVNRMIWDMHIPWANFVKNGAPDTENWPKFEGEIPPVRIFDFAVRTEKIDRTQAMKLWGDMRFYENCHEFS